jgi:hypothetical protein
LKRLGRRQAQPILRCIIPTSAKRDCGKPTEISSRKISPGLEIYAWDLPNARQQCSSIRHSIWCVCVKFILLTLSFSPVSVKTHFPPVEIFDGDFTTCERW